MAPEHPEWKDKQPFKALIEGLSALPHADPAIRALMSKIEWIASSRRASSKART